MGGANNLFPERRAVRILLAAFGMAWSFSAAAAPVLVKAHVDRLVVNLGDPLVYTVEVTALSESAISPVITLPEWQDRVQVRETFMRSEARIVNGRTYIVFTKEARLTASRTGAIALGASRVEWNDPQTRQPVRMETDPVTLDVREATGAEAQATPTPQIGIMRPIKTWARVTWKQVWPLGLGMLLSGAALFLFIRLQQAPGIKPPAAPIPAEPADPRTPEQRALDELGEAKNLKHPEQAKLFYTRLSSILRKYLAEAFDFHAEELTTAELLQEMERREFRSEFLGRVRPYFKECDLIKFANQPPPAESWSTADERAEQLIREPRKRVEKAAAPDTLPAEPGT